MFKTTKKDLVFFDLLSSMMEDTCVAADLLLDLLTNYNDVDNKIKEIEKYEHKCDKTVHELVDELNRSFITPIDREDIFDLTKAMDNITDNIEFAAQRLNLFAIQEIRPRAVETAKLISSCVKELKVVVDEMKQMRTSKLLQEKVIEVNKLENEGDRLYNSLIHDLFTVEKDPIEIIKWKEIIETMESTLDACEEVANIIEGIVSKNV